MSADLIDSVIISCHPCKIDKTKNFYANPLTDEEFNRFKMRDSRKCPHCKAPMEYCPHRISELTIEKEEISVEEWHSKLLNKYWNLKKTADDNFPGLWFSLEFQLSIKRILNIKDCTLPLIGIILGPPGSQKTLGMELERNEKDTYYSDGFSAKAFVSHSTAVKREDLDKIDLLPKIKNKLFLTPELSPTFGKKDDDLHEIISIITRVADGQGYKSDSGAYGGRGYTGEWMFTWIGAAVDIPYKVHRLLGNLGPKMYFIRVPKIKKTVKEYLQQLRGDEFKVKFERVQLALIDYLRTFDTGPELELNTKSGLLKNTWNYDKDDERALRTIVKLGILLAHLRAVVPTRETRDTQGTEYSYITPQIEEPDRAQRQLCNLARGHALSQGRNYVTMEDIPIAVKTVLSTASIERVNIFDLLLKHKGKLTTSEIQSNLNIHEHTAHRTMAELRATKLVELDEGEHSNSEKMITLHRDFRWFKSRDFTKLRQNFIPADYSEYLKENTKKEVASRILPPYYPEKEDDKGLGGNFSASPTFLKCPNCNFRNICQEEIDHHFEHTHNR